MSPNLNPFAEAWVQRTKHEVLNHFIVSGEEHLKKILDEWLTYYHLRRPHQGLGNVPISGELMPEISIDDFRMESVVCHETLGGLLKHYERKAAQSAIYTYSQSSAIELLPAPPKLRPEAKVAGRATSMPSGRNCPRT